MNTKDKRKNRLKIVDSWKRQAKPIFYSLKRKLDERWQFGKTEGIDDITYNLRVEYHIEKHLIYLYIEKYRWVEEIVRVFPKLTEMKKRWKEDFDVCFIYPNKKKIIVKDVPSYTIIKKWAEENNYKTLEIDF